MSGQPLPPAPTDLSALTTLESTLHFPAFNSSTAWNLGLALRTRILNLPASSRKPALISITLGSDPAPSNPHIVFQATTEPGTGPDNEVWVARKRNTVLRWGVSSWLMRTKMLGALGGRDASEVEGAFVRKYALRSSCGGAAADEFAIHGGGVPIRVKGVEGIVGVVVVSGLKQEDDHQVVVECMKEILGQ